MPSKHGSEYGYIQFVVKKQTKKTEEYMDLVDMLVFAFVSSLIHGFHVWAVSFINISTVRDERAIVQFWHLNDQRLDESTLLRKIVSVQFSLCLFRKWNEPGHEKMCLMSYANNKGADQPAHPRSLISAFVVRCLDSIISLDSIAEISKL